MDQSHDVEALLRNIGRKDEASRKLAAFNLQNLVADESYAQDVVRSNGVPTLCSLVKNDKGNTLAYAFGSLNGILEKNLGWDAVPVDVAERAAELIISQATVNVLRNAMHFLVLIASRTASAPESSGKAQAVQGLTMDSLKPILAEHPRFLDALVDRLNSGDHAICVNALWFLNALLRDSLSTSTDSQLMRFIKRLQDLHVYAIIEEMTRTNLTSDIAGPVADFQRLTRHMLQTWYTTSVDLTVPMHLDALSIIQRSVRQKPTHTVSWEDRRGDKKGRKASEREVKAPDSVPWVDLGFQSEQAPTLDFKDTGLLGLIDMIEFAQRHSEFLQKLLLEQSVVPADQRCPVARVSVTSTQILVTYLGIDQTESANDPNIDLRKHHLVLSREKLHTSIARLFFRLWDAAGATSAEFDKIEELVRHVAARLLGSAGYETSIDEVEDVLDRITLAEIRNWQIEALDQLQNAALGEDLSRLTERLHEETMQFIVEQRVQCLLKGAWFPLPEPSKDGPETGIIREPGSDSRASAWRFVQLSPNRRYLHHTVLQERTKTPPAMADLGQSINVNHIGSVTSSTTRADPTNARRDPRNGQVEDVPMIRLIINGTGPGLAMNGQQEEAPLLELPCSDSTQAAEWADGLLMLLDQAPITSETDRLISVMDDWSLKVRLLNLRQEDTEQRSERFPEPIGRPEHEGEYWYDMGGV